MSSAQKKSRVISIVLLTGLVIFAAIAIVSTNLLSWPLTPQFQNGNNSGQGAKPTPSYLLVKAQYTEPQSSSAYVVTPAPGIGVRVFYQSVLSLLVGSNVTDSNGLLRFALRPDRYIVQIQSEYTNFNATVVVGAGSTVLLELNITKESHVATFYDVVDRDSIGQVLPSENIYMELNGVSSIIGLTHAVFIESYSTSYVYPPSENSTSLSSSTLTPNLSQTVGGTIVSQTVMPNNATLWVELRPNSPLNLHGVSTLALVSYTSSYMISTFVNTNTTLVN